MRRIGFVVSGRVQGVGFRWFAQRAAGRCQVAGWVRNDADGSVRGEVEGDDRGLEQFLAALRQGPRGGRVDQLETFDRAPTGEAGFAIR